MHTIILLGIPLLSSPISTAFPSALSPISNNTPRIPQALPVPYAPTNITNIPPPPNAIRIQCDSTHYGHNLSPNSCRNVFDYIAKSDMQTTFAERHTGRPNDLPLPWRIQSSDGLCFVQPLLLHGAVTAHASSTQMAQAAYALFQRCVVERGVGGIAVDIGACLISLLQVCMLCRVFLSEISQGGLFRTLVNGFFLNRWRQSPQCSHRGLRTQCPLRPNFHPRPTMGLLLRHRCGHAGDDRSEGVWGQEPRSAGGGELTFRL